MHFGLLEDSFVVKAGFPCLYWLRLGYKHINTHLADLPYHKKGTHITWELQLVEVSIFVWKAKNYWRLHSIEMAWNTHYIQPPLRTTSITESIVTLADNKNIQCRSTWLVSSHKDSKSCGNFSLKWNKVCLPTRHTWTITVSLEFLLFFVLKKVMENYVIVQKA